MYIYILLNIAVFDFFIVIILFTTVMTDWCVKSCFVYIFSKRLSGRSAIDEHHNNVENAEQS